MQLRPLLGHRQQVVVPAFRPLPQLAACPCLLCPCLLRPCPCLLCLPCCRYDSDHPRVSGDVGMAGVAVDSVEDMKVGGVGV
jgi:hypothetical protein